MRCSTSNFAKECNEFQKSVRNLLPGDARLLTVYEIRRNEAAPCSKYDRFIGCHELLQLTKINCIMEQDFTVNYRYKH
jgi:hypothetical protein